MKVHVAPPLGLSRAMTRVEVALTTYLPFGSHVVKRVEDADLEVLHVIGYRETVKRVEEARKAGRKYAIIQYCFRSTQKPSHLSWYDIWGGASVVWSYYDLKHGHKHPGLQDPYEHYYAPLGIDTPFHRLPDPKGTRPTLLLTTGYVAPSECLGECAAAVAQRKGSMVHVGPDLSLGAHVVNKLGIFDEELAKLYHSSRFVAGLRRVEGFEMPVYEGLACGARPIVFDAPHYRHWLGEHALYVPETDNPTAGIAQALQTYAPVTSDEMRWVKEKFSWKPIIEGFWERAL